MKFLHAIASSAEILAGITAMSLASVDVGVEHGVAMKTRDGVTLRADI